MAYNKVSGNQFVQGDRHVERALIDITSLEETGSEPLDESDFSVNVIESVVVEGSPDSHIVEHDVDNPGQLSVLDSVGTETGSGTTVGTVALRVKGDR